MERELLDYHEEMGILIQEVVGQRSSLSAIVFRSGIQPERIPLVQPDSARRRRCSHCAGIGTRAVDRLSDDYPIMLAPGQPGLRVNVSLDEKYAIHPKKVDVIHLEHNQFETVELSRLLRDMVKNIRRSTGLYPSCGTSGWCFHPRWASISKKIIRLSHLTD
ncbi:MAG: hypothetical protein R3C26_06465 [Calditrichia bacterium]